MTSHEKIEITSETRHLSTIRDFITRLVRSSPLKSEEHNKIILAVDEAVTNTIQHGYDGHPEGRIEVEVISTPTRFEIIIRDSGKSFDPGSIKPPDMMQHVSSGMKHGLGLFLMRQIMDEVRYSFKEGVKNELRLVKYIGVQEF